MVLPKSWAGSITMLSRATPAASARSAYAVVSAIALATTSSYSMRCGLVRGVTPPVCVQMIATSYSAATSTSAGSAPPQASLSTSAPASQTARPTGRAPGVDADHHVGMSRPHPLDEPDRAPLLLLDVDLLARERP